MPRVLREHQHEIGPVDSLLDDGFLFGTEDTGYLTTTRPLITNGDVRLGDVERSNEDGRVMGRDFMGAKTYSFEIEVITDKRSVGTDDPYGSNLDYINDIEAFWTDEVWRDNPRAMAMLRSCEAGRTSRCYGRPRKWDEVAGALTQRGYTPLIATFDLNDNRWYSEVENVQDVHLQAGSEGGFFAPIVAPITTTAASESTSSGVVTIGGRVATWLVVEFHGPSLNPEVQIGDMRIGLTGTLSSDDVAVYDPRPWVRSVTLQSNGAGMAGMVSSATPKMAACSIKPGTYQTVLRGIDASGTAFVRLRWRDARTRP